VPPYFVHRPQRSVKAPARGRLWPEIEPQTVRHDGDEFDEIGRGLDYSRSCRVVQQADSRTTLTHDLTVRQENLRLRNCPGVTCCTVTLIGSGAALFQVDLDYVGEDVLDDEADPARKAVAVG